MGAAGARTCDGEHCSKHGPCALASCAAAPQCCTPARWQSYGEVSKQVAAGWDLQRLAVIAREDTGHDSPTRLGDGSPRSICSDSHIRATRRAWRSLDRELQEELREEQVLCVGSDMRGILFEPSWSPHKDAEVAIIDEDEVMQAYLPSPPQEVGGITEHTAVGTPRPPEGPQSRHSPSPEATPDFGSRSPAAIGVGGYDRRKRPSAPSRVALRPLDMNSILAEAAHGSNSRPQKENIATTTKENHRAPQKQ
mmetsp:Transcript_43877/g.103770  ORF Transcript_43877/g.103770 Transcript_43877/m.103770 type:complete len:252 (-) Transcript_43877:173-928(-)|eukprot:CAMPEP_0178410744 /NCGR_PEP_ID=MMETSP0689_2-20121128/21142_1 /TAXON_ID=160604 /ORGANISM="Amphidinium massartii, Strain CS-259" /LENGTH=251 /DNA_ID=CAMNT_0020031939 /DNA_START=44 /DNA_END=799 /DNA_ORIENTATION=-